MDYQRKFNKDIIIDFICFRKHGHNELDEPSFTQPVMYKAVKARESIPNQYANLIVVCFGFTRYSLGLKNQMISQLPALLCSTNSL